MSRPSPGGEFAVFDQVGLAGGEDEIAAGDIDLAAAERHGIKPLSTERMMSSGADSPASMKVLVMRGIGMCA